MPGLDLLDRHTPRSTANPLLFIQDPYMREEVEDTFDPDDFGLHHVTVARDRVLAEGLKSRRQLGYQVQGLGGVGKDESPDRVSLTWSLSKAHAIRDALLFATDIAAGRYAAVQAYGRVLGWYDMPDDLLHPLMASTLRSLGIPDDVLEDVNLVVSGIASPPDPDMSYELDDQPLPTPYDDYM